jgi:hypothetical protein
MSEDWSSVVWLSKDAYYFWSWRLSKESIKKMISDFWKVFLIEMMDYDYHLYFGHTNVAVKHLKFKNQGSRVKNVWIDKDSISTKSKKRSQSVPAILKLESIWNSKGRRRRDNRREDGKLISRLSRNGVWSTSFVARWGGGGNRIF